MTKRDFLLKLAFYYKTSLIVKVNDVDNHGKLKEIPNPDLEIVGKWLDTQNLSETELDQLFLKVTLNFNPTSIVQFPKLGFFNDMLNGDNDLRAERAWENLKGLSAMDSYVFEDLKTQQVIESLSGDICSFVQWKDSEKNVWCKKEFIKLYIQECKNPRDIKRKVLLGYNDLTKKNNNGQIGQYGIRFRGNKTSRFLTQEEFKQLSISSDNFEVNGLIENMIKKVTV